MNEKTSKINLILCSVKYTTLLVNSLNSNLISY